MTLHADVLKDTALLVPPNSRNIRAKIGVGHRGYEAKTGQTAGLGA
jgi:hypothetical protein